jgi:hypothetical protein
MDLHIFMWSFCLSNQKPFRNLLDRYKCLVCQIPANQGRKEFTCKHGVDYLEILHVWVHRQSIREGEQLLGSILLAASKPRALHFIQ